MTERRKEYNQAVELAESGQYEQALQQLQVYLKAHPKDGEALNDIGTILFCMHRGQEAIDYYLLARSCCCGDTLGQVIFNLCEAYLAEDQPEKAVGLLDSMESMEILNVDTVNRIANAFINKRAYGPAIEMLLYSLRQAPNQEILKPILDILRMKRIKVSLFANNEQKIRALKSYLGSRFVVQTYPGSAQGSMVSAQSLSDVSIFVGCVPSLAGGEFYPNSNPIIVFLDFEDLSSSWIEQIPWDRVHTLIVPDHSVREILQERLETICSSLQILTIPPCADVDSVAFIDRKKGKRIAAIGPWNAHQNPMFLLQCMQKLHFLDPDMRLYLAGEFEDKTILQYMEFMIEAMELENSVFLDGIPKNWNRWLKDKHYIVSTAVDGRGLKDVLVGMAAGLRPVVHRCPYANEFMESEYLFVLAEDFCRQILDGTYQPKRYRETAVHRYSTLQAWPVLLRILSEIEIRVLDRSLPGQMESKNPTESVPIREEIPAFSEPEFSFSPPYVPAEEIRVAPESTCLTSGSETIAGVAQKALQAAQRLSELSRKHEDPAKEAVNYSEGGQPAVPFLQQTSY